MSNTVVYALGSNQMSITGGQGLSAGSQGDGSHLLGQVITLNGNVWDRISLANSACQAKFTLTLSDPMGSTYTVGAISAAEPGTMIEGLTICGDVAGQPPVDVPLTITAITESPTHGATSPGFTAGCKILTPNGPVAIEALNVGDLVETLDNGPQPLRGIDKTHLAGSTLNFHPELRPIRIAKNAFGKGHPECDLHLSPQHRILISGWRAEIYFGQDEALAPVKTLLNDGSVRPDTDTTDVTYYHLLLDQHEVLQCDGLYSESSFRDAPTHSERDAHSMLPQLLDVDLFDWPEKASV